VSLSNGRNTSRAASITSATSVSVILEVWDALSMLYPSLLVAFRLRQPQDHIAVALAQSAHRAEAVRHRVLKPDQLSLEARNYTATIL
jgi:hypothetical protein